MQVRDLFVLVIKLVVVSMGIDILFTTLPTVLLFFTAEFDVLDSNKLTVIAVVLSLLVLVLLYVLAGRIVDVLQVEKGLKSTTIQTNSFTLLHVAQLVIFCMGLGLLISHLPSFLSNSLFWFKAKAVENPYEYVQTGNYWFVSLFNLIIGYLFVANAPRIAQWVVKGQNKT